MQYFKYDENGYFVGDVTAETKPKNCTKKRPPQPCYRPRWDGENWIEEAPPLSEYDVDTEMAIWDWENKVWEIIPKPRPMPTYEDALAALADLGIVAEEVPDEEL